MRIFFSLFFILMFSISSSVFAEQLILVPETQIESKPATENDTSSVAELYFQFDRGKLNLQEESVKVGEESKIEVCLRLNKKDLRLSPYIQYLRSYQVVLALNDSSVKAISNPVKFRKKLLKPDGQGCYWSTLFVPKASHPGNYQVTQLDLLLDSGRALSLRNLLPQFKPLATLQVISIHEDDAAPILERVEFLSPEVSPIHFGGKRAVTSAQMRLVAHDLLSGIDPKSLEIYFKVYFDQDWVDSIKADCFPSFENLYYDCSIDTSRASFQLRTRQVRFVLNSISLQDKLGNFVEYSELEKLKTLNHGQEMSFLFYSQMNEEVRKIKKEHQNYKKELQKDKKEVDSPSTFSRPEY